MSAQPPPVDPAGVRKTQRFRKTRIVLLVILSAILAAAAVSWWTTRDAAIRLSSLHKQGVARGGRKTIVDVSPWQTAQTLASLAKSMEEVNYAREAQRLGDHEVDQAFASALRRASIQHRTYTGNALTLSQRVTQLEKVVQDDQAHVKTLTPVTANAPNAAKPADSQDSDDLEVAKAQLGLDNDILDDAQDQLAQATGDNRAQIQQELAAHQAAEVKYDSQAQQAESANVAVHRNSTLAGRIQSWFAQSSRYDLLQQATQQAQSDTATLTAGLASLQSNAKSAGQSPAQPDAAPAPEPDHADKLATLRQRTGQLQLITIENDRIQTEKQLTAVYQQWTAQLLLQHRLLLHLMLESVAWIALILIAVVLINRLVRHLLDRPALDLRRMQTLRTILELTVQLIGAISILLVCFGTPRQISTILGLATAGLTVALQDFILAFLGWFVLMGRNGIRLGDAVEINGVAGEVAEVGLFRTTIMETGNSTDEGHPTGRRVAFLNKYAINGQYFNFSTVGQWMWDEISVNIPESENAYGLIERIHKAVIKETDKDAHLAEEEWKRVSKVRGLSQFAAGAQINLRPAASGVNLLIRYVTRAGNRFEMRNRLYQSTIEVLHQPNKSSTSAEAN